MFSYIRRTSVLCTIIRNTYTSDVINQSNSFWQYLQDNYKNALTQPSTISKETWENVRKHIMESQCYSYNPDCMILDTFKHKKYPDAGIFYYKFLVDNNYKPTIPVTIKYLQLYKIKNDPISESDKEYILSLYNNISNHYTSFSKVLSEAFIQCLSKMGEWKEAIKIIEKHEENDDCFLRYGYTSLISCLFDHEEENLGYEYLIRSLQKEAYEGPFDNAYTTYLKYCKKEKDTFNTKVEKLFLLWSAYGIKPSQDIAFECMKACIERGWSVSTTTVSRLRCNNCNTKISQLSLSDKDYKHLLEATKKCLIFNKIYYVTSPQEMKSYINFIDKNKPYDIIIDGLNVMYLTQSKHNIVQIVESYKNQNKKILIIGRKHMKKFMVQTGLQGVDCFFVENESKDDLFLLYAAFASGENARIISNDTLRQHIFALKDIELNALFRKWQLGHQFCFHAKKGCIQLNAMYPIDAFVQKENNNWHIPYLATDKISRMRHTFTDQWLCFKMN